MGTNASSRRGYTEEFRKDAVKVWRESNDSIEAVASRIGIKANTLGKWIKQAEIDNGNRPGLTTDEHNELVRLRKENKRLQMERDLMKKAAAFFATDETK